MIRLAVVWYAVKIAVRFVAKIIARIFAEDRMAVPTVTLTGRAVTGVAPHLHALAGFETAALPTTVRLGRRPPIPGKSFLHLRNYFRDGKPLALPDKVDYASKAAASISQMDLNDQFGDCVIAGKCHAVGVWTANAVGKPALATDAEVYATYQSWCGPGDNGCVITDVLDRMKASGIPLSGVPHKLDGYVACDWTKQAIVEAAVFVFGAATIGINLPEAWTQSDVWDVTNTPIVGGHDVTCVGYDATGVQIASWGRVYTITWKAFLATTWLEEMYALLSPDWSANGGVAPSGLNVAQLQADLAAIGGGTVPPDPTPPVPPVPPTPPTPPVPPQPPTPPGAGYTGQFAVVWSFSNGLVTAAPSVVPVNGPTPPVPSGPETIARAAGLTPELIAAKIGVGFNWQAITQLIAQYGPIVAQVVVALLTGGITPALIAQVLTILPAIIAALFGATPPPSPHAVPFAFEAA